MTHILAYDEALERLQIAAKGREDYINAIPVTPDNNRWESWMERTPMFDICRYLHADNTPSCIIGTAWAIELIEAGLTSDSRQNTTDVSIVLCDLLGMTLTPKATELLKKIQFKQDDGYPWGTAIEAGITAAHDYSDTI